jgi:hypothetical protein
MAIVHATHANGRARLVFLCRFGKATSRHARFNRGHGGARIARELRSPQSFSARAKIFTVFLQ